MSNSNFGKQLVALAQLDVDAVRAYTQAIEKIDVDEIRGRLEHFRRDHERHIQDLTPHIEALGEQPPAHTPDVKGVLIEGMTALRSITGTEGALKAMRMNEQLTNSRYEAALQSEMPSEVRAVVEKNREDERRHLQYIDHCLKNETWTRADAARAAR
jgi:rubrerythrin